jgi:hypothetical protein
VEVRAGRLWAGSLPYATLALGALSLFIPFANYGFTGDLTGGDAAIAWALPDSQLRQVVGVYIDGPGLGYNGATGLAAAFPALSLATLLHAIGLPTAMVARLMIALYFFLAMSGALRLFEALLPAGRISRGAAFVGALFYGVNRYTVLLYFTAQTYFPMVYAALPWLLYGVVLGCERRAGAGIAVIVGATIFAGGAGSNPALFAVALCAIAIGALLELAHGAPAKRVLLIAGAGTALGLGCCAWWIVPLATSIGAGLDTVSAAGVPSWAQWMSERSSFLNLLKLDGYTGAQTMPFADWYASPLGSMIGCIPLAVGIAGFGTYRRRLSAVALLAFAVAAFLSKGVHEPFGWAYQALLDHVPGFSIFRSPYVKWIALEAVLLSLLFALGLAGLCARLRRLAVPKPGVPVRWLLAAAAVAVVAYPWPAYAGRMLAPDYGGVGFLSTLPHEYREVAEVISRSARGARTVVFNGGSLPYPFYTWGYFGQDPLQVAVDSPIAPFETLLPEAPRMSAQTLAAALRALGVRFVAVHRDVLNPVASPQADVLVAAGAATSVYRSRIVDLYALSGQVPPAARTLDAPLLAAARHVSVPDDRISGGTGSPLNPNVGLLVSRRALEVIVPTSRAQGQGAQSGRLGWVRDVTDDVETAPAGSRLTLVRGNPLAVVLRSADCAGGGSGLRVASPSRWSIGNDDLGALATTVCFTARRSGQIRSNGVTPDPSARQISLLNGSPLRIEAPLVGPLAGTAMRLERRGLPFAFRVPSRTSVVELILPERFRAAAFTAVVNNLRGDVVGGSSWPSLDGVVVVRFPKPLRAGRPFLAYLQSADPAAYVSLQPVRRIPFSIVEGPWQAANLPIDQRIMRSVDLRSRSAPATERIAVPLPLASPIVGHSPLAWAPGDVSPSNWSVNGGRVRLRSAERATELHVQGTLLGTDRYVLRFTYVATGYAELWTRIDGVPLDRITHLVSDGRPHRFVTRLFPVPGSNGEFMLRLRSSRGAVELVGAALEAEGPNGAVLAWRQGTPFGGRVVAVTRPVPWLFDVRVRDCAPCMLSLGVSDPLHWMVGGAVVRASYTGPGGPTGPWAGITTGAATWLVDVGPGVKDLRIAYTPALLALAGLLVALGSAGITVALALCWEQRAEPSLAQAEGDGPPEGLMVVLAGVTLAGAAIGGFSTPAGEFVADALWLALAVVATREWVRDPGPTATDRTG